MKAMKYIDITGKKDIIYYTKIYKFWLIYYDIYYGEGYQDIGILGRS